MMTRWGVALSSFWTLPRRPMRLFQGAVLDIHLPIFFTSFAYVHVTLTWNDCA